MKLSLIAAVADNGVIGVKGKLPWKLPADLQYFKKITMGHPIIMGRKTYESIGRPLPGRRNIVLSRIKHLSIPGCEVVSTLEAALQKFGETEEVFVIGGESIYKEALPFAHQLYLTQVHAQVEGDTYFPHYEKSDWIEISREYHHADSDNQYTYSFVIFNTKSRVL